jgi:hypothetical protein
MEKSGDLAGLRVDSGQIRTFVQIAAVACKRQIFDVVRAAVLLRDDVLDMMPEFGVLLSQTTVFALVAGSTPNEVPRGCVHRLLDR